MITKPTPFKEAIRLLLGKDLMPTQLDTNQLNAIDAAIRRFSMFSAQVTDAGFLQEAADVVARIVEPQSGGGAPGSYMDVPTARLALKDYLTKIGYQPDPDKAGTLQDLSSDRRLNLVIKTNTQLAQGYGQHVQANDPEVIDLFPCLELIRAGPREKPRDWINRWRGAGGHFYGGGRMIARKDDPIWTTISRFGNPYPPFDFNSGMWTRSIRRREAIALGVIAKDEKVKPNTVGFSPPPPLDLGSLSKGIAQALQDAIDNQGETP